MVLTMIPGIFAGLESAQIDYDAVAYRTSVILCEDPGWSTGEDYWETIDTEHKDDIERLGLALSSISPNILSNEKVNRFFNNNPNLVLTEEDYRSKVIFGDVPYLFNISFKIGDGPLNSTGSVVPDSRCGYMRRLVKIKEPGSAMIDSALYNKSAWDYLDILNVTYTGFSVSFNYNELQNKSIEEAYRFMPQTEPASITIFNFANSLEANITSASLDKIRLKKDGVELPLVYNSYDNDTYRFFVDDSQHTMQGPIPIKNASVLRYEMYPPLLFSDEVGSTLSLQFNVTYTYIPDGGKIPHYYMSGDFPYDYRRDYMIDPYLKEGVMEVMIW